MFAEALENGLATSRAIGLVITPESVTSGWIKEEYYRALSLSKEKPLQLIPLILRDATMPGFLQSRHYISFLNEATYDIDVDKIVWPGITGKRIVVYTVDPYRGGPWDLFEDVGAAIGMNVRKGEDCIRLPWLVSEGIEKEPETRIVLAVDIFEGAPEKKRARTDPREYIDLIFDLRARTKGTTNEIVFILYHHSHAFELGRRVFSPDVQKRLGNFFTLHRDLPRADFQVEARTNWYRVQQEVLRTDKPLESS
jgi:hypothetical protein